MNKLEVNLVNKEYKIYIENGILHNINSLLKKHINNRVFIITDKNVEKLYLSSLIDSLTEYEVGYFVATPGEGSKSLDVATEIYSKMLDFKCDRKTTLISLGGGVVGDLSGFVASTYMRGIEYIQIPTTLLSQVDSSIGGKVAINLKRYKNIIGSFYHPRAVIIDLEVLSTLEKRQMISGIGEVLKYGLINDYSFFLNLGENTSNIFNLDYSYIKDIILKSLETKKKIVELDEKEENLRKVLNFGHSIGHGIESLDDFKRYYHGEAVLLGMIYESYVAKLMGLISEEYYIQIKETISMFIKFDTFSDKEIQLIMEGLAHDKKNELGNPVLILPTGKGQVEIVKNIDEDIIIRSLREGI